MEGATLNLLKRTNTAGKDGTEPGWPSALPTRHAQLCLLKIHESVLAFKRQCTQIAGKKTPSFYFRNATPWSFILATTK